MVFGKRFLSAQNCLLVLYEAIVAALSEATKVNINRV